MTGNSTWIAYIIVPSETDAEGHEASLGFHVPGDVAFPGGEAKLLDMAVDALWMLKRAKIDPDTEKTSPDEWSLAEVPRTVAPEKLFDSLGTEYAARQFVMDRRAA